MRIYELAKELGINKKDLVAKVRNLGFPVSNFMSAIDPDAAPRIRAHVERERQANVEQVQVSKAVFRRRRKDRAPAEALHAGGADATRPDAAAESAPPVAPDPRDEMDAAARFKLALEESLRQHLERTPQKDESVKLSGTVRRRTPKKRGAAKPAFVETPLSAIAPSPGQEPDGEVATPAPPVAASAEPVAAEPTAPVAAPVTPEVEVAPAVVAEPASPPVEAPQPAPVAEAPAPPKPEPAAKPVAAKAPATPAPPRPAPKRPARSSSPDAAVVVAIPDQQERDRRLGLTGPRRRGARRGAKTTITRKDLYRSSGGFGGWRRGGKKKATKSGGAKTAITVPSEHKRVIRIDDSITVSELAQRMGIKAAELIRALLKMGTMVSITQSLDVDTATLVATEFGYDIKNVAFQEDDVLEDDPDAEEDLVARAPIVTMMGHVDHGKTSLLDKIREAKVAAGEAGGITQHIGAYTAIDDGAKIVFLDTPGHEAFTSMRARGAQATDIVVLVVAANDGVMPQTVEAINHSKDAGVAIIVALNKMDLPGANPDRVRTALAEHELITEEWGGETQVVPVSAKTGEGIDDLMEAIRLQAEMLELRANPTRRAKGVILESRLSTGRGVVATGLVQSGTIKVGDIVVAGTSHGRVRAMNDDRGKRIKSAGPATPVEIVGLNEIPSAGDLFNVVADDKAARAVVEHRQSQQRRSAPTGGAINRDLAALLGAKEIKEVKVIIKADVHGSAEALREALLKLSTDDVKVTVIHTGVGGVTESDVVLASAAVGRDESTEVLIIAFNVRAKPKVMDSANSHGVRINAYTVIYDALEETKALMAGMLAPTIRENYLGRAEVRETFNIPKVGTVAGCMIIDGRIKRGARVRLLRNEVIVWEGHLGSLRRFKDDVKDVAQGFECGIGLEGYNDIHLGDIIEGFEMEEVAAEL